MFHLFITVSLSLYLMRLLPPHSSTTMKMNYYVKVKYQMMTKMKVHSHRKHIETVFLKLLRVKELYCCERGWRLTNPQQTTKQISQTENHVGLHSRHRQYLQEEAVISQLI